MSDINPIIDTKPEIQIKSPVKKKPTKKNTIVMTKATENSLKEGVKKFGKIIEMAVKRNLNESDTSNIINDMLGETFGYDKFFDVTTEYKIK